MKDLINKFITLGKKAKVLLGIDSNKEPRVSTMTLQDGSTSYTFNSSCFPFFSEDGFETVDENSVNTFIEKCELYIKTLENNVTLSMVKEEDSYNPKPIKKSDSTGVSYFLFKTKDKKCRIHTSVCDKHKNKHNTSNLVTNKKDYTCYYSYKVEELDN